MGDRIKQVALRVPGLLPLDFKLRGYRRMLSGNRELKLLKFLVNPEKTAVDVGANKGYFTFWLEKYAAHVHAYEPNPHNYFYLRGARGKVTLHQAALSDAADSTTFRVRVFEEKRFWRRLLGGGGRLDHRGGSLHHQAIGEHFIEYPVEIRRLDDESPGAVGFLKIDVEGHELSVLRGAKTLIATHRPVLLIEIEQRHNGAPTNQVIATVEALGYRGIAITRQGLQTAATLDPATYFDYANRTDYVLDFIFLPA
ncbi:MAG: FkbM family methyltransferase [SAR324 cluster bacterium]|nr:FkbM family methyltransferase [SAR324 cluster bacterium]MCH8885861.1 FkbM family methyltransferase [SAR324 cluster bacterium]